MAAATPTTTMSKRRFPARTISRKNLAATRSTIRPIAASSGKSGSAWITGPSFARTRLGIDAENVGFGGLRCERGHGLVCAGRGGVRRALGGDAGHLLDARRGLAGQFRPGRDRYVTVVV